jgi:hypothetical protein
MSWIGTVVACARFTNRNRKSIILQFWSLWDSIDQKFYPNDGSNDKNRIERPISCWLSSLAVEYHLVWTIISYVVWYSSKADDIQLKQLILNWRGRYSSRADDIHPMETIFIQEWRISSKSLDNIQPLGIIINHWGW